MAKGEDPSSPIRERFLILCPTDLGKTSPDLPMACAYPHPEIIFKILILQKQINKFKFKKTFVIASLLHIQVNNLSHNEHIPPQEETLPTYRA